MDKTNDLVIGAVTGYKKEQLQYWVNSLNQCGFTGKKLLICFDIDPGTIRWLNDNQIGTCEINGISKEPSFSIVVDRFLFYYLTLRDMEDVRYVVATDVKDVIFQCDPSELLEEAMDLYDYRDPECHFLLSSEELIYANEPWGANNLRLSFPVHYDRLIKRQIVNCGVIAGRYEYFTDLCSQLYYMCGRSAPFIQGGGGPDQAALNVLMSQRIFRDYTRITHTCDAWAAQLGTTGDPHKLPSFLPHLLDTPPLIKEDGTVMSRGYISCDIEKPFAIVHQWDRLAPHHVQKIKEKYS